MQPSSSSSSSEVDNALRLEWEDLYYRSNAAGTGPGREILRHVSGQARPGRLLAIMGPSGSGKTTLLNTLSGQLPYHSNMRLTGNVYVMEEDSVERKAEEKGSVRSPSTAVVGRRGGSGESGFVFVKQEDLFYSQLTVREILIFTARLRLSRKMADAEKRAYVDDMINRMGLTEAADTLVGDEKKRGISGGERKRLSLACELMGNPSKIIFADEPTSGLDSFQSQSVMTRMKRLCEEGPSGQRHTVIVSIHQPRSTVYSMFDDIILLSEGQVIYHGPADGAIDYFGSLGFVCPSHFNPSEWMLDLVSIDHSSPERRAESQQRVRKLAQAYEDLLKQQQRQQQSDSTGAITTTSTSSLPSSSSSSSSKRKSLKTYLLLSSLHARHTSTRQHHPSWFAQFRLLIARQWKQTSRDIFTNGLRATTTLLLAAMFGSIFYQLDTGEDGIEERSAVLMHTCINTAMIAMVKTLNLFTRERAVIGRERTKSLYSTSAYVLSKVFGELPIDAFFPVIFGCVLCPMAGLQRDGKRFAWFLGTLALQTLTSSALGLTIGSLCPSTEAALTMGPSIMVVLILLSGQVGTKSSKIPPYLRGRGIEEAGHGPSAHKLAASNASSRDHPRGQLPPHLPGTPIPCPTFPTPAPPSSSSTYCDCHYSCCWEMETRAFASALYVVVLSLSEEEEEQQQQQQRQTNASSFRPPSSSPLPSTLASYLFGIGYGWGHNDKKMGRECDGCEGRVSYLPFLPHFLTLVEETENQ
ncbi:hypothetical protein VYU27_004911 [Nannochloropsis oceanica]